MTLTNNKNAQYLISDYIRFTDISSLLADVEADVYS